MLWHRSHRADPRARTLADRHYNRQNPEAANFVPPGACLVLLTRNADAVWVSSAPIAAYVLHEWAGAWTCTLFRREPDCPYLASTLIIDAVAATSAVFGEPPEQGFITFVDDRKTRWKRDPGYCYLMAGWKKIGRSKGGLYALGLSREAIQAIRPEVPLKYVPHTDQMELFA